MVGDKEGREGSGWKGNRKGEEGKGKGIEKEKREREREKNGSPSHGVRVDRYSETHEQLRRQAAPAVVPFRAQKCVAERV